MTLEGGPLGIAGTVTTAEAEQLIEALSRAWEVVHGRPPGDLEDDLDAARSWFDPVAQGQRLRREIAGLPKMPEDLTDPEHPLTLRLDEGKWLVTPEGRCVLHLLQGLPHEQTIHDIGQSLLAPYERRLAVLYRRWSRHRLESVVALLAGTNKPLQIPAAGIVVALLVNRSTSSQRALVRFRADPERSVVDKAFFGPVQSFADILAPNRRRSTISAHLISGWMLYEVRRRIGDALVLKDARDDKDGAVWIEADQVATAVDTASRDLVRGHRAPVATDRFVEAFDCLVGQLRQASPALAGFGLAHERPRDTQRLRELFTDRLSYYAKARA